MAHVTNRLPENVRGSWFIDSSCIDCDQCRAIAPTIFTRDDEIGFSVVFHQPETEEEKRLATEARDSCPVDAIGNEPNDPSSQA
jgi:ferredoxin